MGTDPSQSFLAANDITLFSSCNITDSYTFNYLIPRPVRAAIAVAEFRYLQWTRQLILQLKRYNFHSIKSLTDITIFFLRFRKRSQNNTAGQINLAGPHPQFLGASGAALQ